jgi:hypothetical protein
VGRPPAAASEDALEHRDEVESDSAAGFRVVEYELAETAMAVGRRVARPDAFPALDTLTVEAAGSWAVASSAARTVARIPASGSWPMGVPPLAVQAARFSEPAAG